MDLRDWITVGDVEEVRKHVQQGFDPNRHDVFGMSWLMWAARSGHTEIVELFVNHGADVNAKNEYDATALWYAAGRNTEMVTLLLENGAELNGKDMFSRSPLTSAACEGKTDIVKLLLENGADIEDNEYNMEVLTCTVRDILEDAIQRRKQLKMARYALLWHTNFHLAQEIALRMN